MRKTTILWMSALTLVVGAMFTACGDNKSEEGYDDEYKVSYYNYLSYANEQLGFMYNATLIRLYPQGISPFYVQTDDAEGKSALDHIRANRGDVINKVELIRTNGYLVTANLRFESPYFYVSDIYNVNPNPTVNEGIIVLPQIIVKMASGKSIESLMSDYEGTLTFAKENISEDIKYTFYELNCSLKTSREVLRLALKIHQRDDVEWAQPLRIDSEGDATD